MNNAQFIIKLECEQMHMQATGMHMHRNVKPTRVHRHVYITCQHSAKHNNESQEAFEDSGYFTKIGDMPIML